MLYRTRLAVLCALGAMMLCLGVPVASGQTCVAWQQQRIAPDAREQHAMAFDSARGVTVLFGGFTDTRSNETWEYDGSTWTQRAVSGPSARVQSGMAYDAARGVCVLFGGDIGAPSGETWEWDGAAWTQRAIAGPSARYRHAMAYDSLRHVVVLFGGFDGSVRNNQTWEYDGTAWTQRTPGGSVPSARSTPAMTYDNARNVSVLFGGFDGADYSPETWEWNGTAWTLRGSTGPSARTLAQLSFDSARGVSVMTGGRNASGDLDDTWEWSGTAWTQRNTGGIPTLEGHATVFDSARGVTVLFGGGAGSQFFDTTREWNGTAWTIAPVGGPGPRSDAGATFDSARSTEVVFGGLSTANTPQADTWERTGGGPWTLRPASGPLARSGQAMAFDSNRGISVLFGGLLDGGTISSGTWEWDGTTWNLRTTGVPGGRFTHAMVYDSVRQVTVLFGGDTGGGAASGETWEWDGTGWTQRVVAGPSARFAHAMAYDSTRHVTVLFGGWDGTTRNGETWEWNGAAWTQPAVSGPSARRSHAMAYDAARGVTVLSGGQTASGGSAEVWEWNGTAWSLRSTPSPAPARFGHSLVMDTARAQAVMFGGMASTLQSGQTWELGTSPATSITQQPASANLCVAADANFAVVAAGTAPLSYQWRRNGVNLADGGIVSGSTTSALHITGVDATYAGTYTVVVTGQCGSVTSAGAALTVSANPTITQQPVAQTVCSGQNASFSVTATSGQTLTYRWRRNGVNLNNGGAISGATTPTLTITGAASANAGNYDVRITSSCGNSTSSVAALTVNALTTISQQPSPATVCTGQGTSLTVTAAGTGTLTYQWRRNGTNLTNGGAVSGATTATLTINPAGAANAGTYDVIVTGTCGAVTSGGAAVTINVGPSISQQPAGASPCVGQPLSLSVTATGSGTLGYQWRRGGVNLSNGGGVSGATTAALSIASVGAGDAGNYDCVITNTCASVTSSAAAVTVGAATSISAQPASRTDCPGQTATFSVSATGTGTLTYQWRRNGVNLSNGGRISGATSVSLAISAVIPGDANTYDVVVTGSCGTLTSAAATLTVSTAPTVTQPPSGLDRCAGQGATFSVVGAGTGPLSYQWRRNSANLSNGGGISGATSASVTISAVATGDAGNYDCVITNACGTITSATAALAVNVSPSISQQPAADTRCTGQAASFAVSASGTAPLSYQWRRNGTNLTNGGGVSGATAATLSIAAAGAGDAGTYDCVITNTCGTTTSAAATLTVTTPPTISQDPVSAERCEGLGTAFSVTAAGTAPLSYQWRRNGTNLTNGAGIAGATTATLSIGAVATGNAGGYDVVVTNSCGTATSSAATLTVDTAPTLSQQPAAQNRCVGQSASFGVTAAGTGPLAYQWRRNGTDLANSGGISGATSATLLIAAPATGDAGNYDVIVTGACGSITSQAAALTVSEPTTVTQDPAGAARCDGQGVTFSVVAGGTGPLSYQWRRNGVALVNGGGISGVTTSTLSIGGVIAGDAGGYDCVVTNSCGTATSAAATLTVGIPPTVAQQPAAVTRCEGLDATFTVAAAGSTATYQWRRSGANLNDGLRVLGSTATTLTIMGVTTADAGSYDCVVTNSCGTATSSAATLTVNTAPAISQQPAGQTRCTGLGAGFTVTATGTGPLSYQWRRNGANLSDGAGVSGSTSASLAIATASAGDAGSYDCVVTNACGLVTSAAAALTVNSPPVVSTPAAQTRCIGQPVSFNVAASGAGPLAYQWRHGGVNIADGPGVFGAESTTLTITSASPGDAGDYDAVVTGACGSTTSGQAVFTVNPATVITQQPATQSHCDGQDAVFSVAAAGSGTLTYQWRRNGAALTSGGRISGATGATLTVSALLDTDAGSYDAVVTGSCGPATSSAAVLSVDVGPSITQQPSAQTQCAGQGVTFSILAVGSGTLTYQWRHNGAPLTGDGNISGASTPTLHLTNLTAAQDGTFDVVVTNLCRSVTSAGATLSVNAAPAVSQQPGPLTRCSGQSAAFSVTATGASPLAYQWRRDGTNLSNGAGVSGATSATLTIAAAGTADAGAYDCVITNACGAAASNAGTLSVQVAPTIGQQPVAATRCTGQGVSFSVAAAGSGPFTYQWRLGGSALSDGANVAGSATATLTIVGAAAADAGAYDCIVTGPCGSVTSSTGALTVNTPPAIATHPQPLTRCTGQAATLTVVATGAGPLTYQWRRDGANLSNGSGISGATTATLGVSSAIAGNLGSFDVVVTNACGSATSAAATVTFNTAPSITEAPAGHKRCAGQTEVMTVVAVGTEPMTYQWQRNGVNLVNGGTVSGATSPTLVIASVVDSDAGDYVCVVANSCGSTPSATAMVTVSAPPTVLTQPTPVKRCNGESASFTITATGVAPLTYQWRRDGVNLVNGPNIAGATSATLSIVAAAPANAGSYDCVVTNTCGSRTSDAVTLTVHALPAITQQPSAQSPCAGTNVSFTVGASGATPLSYRWRRNGVNLADGGRISGSASATVTITSADSSDAGSYDCVVTNTCSAATSSAAALVISAGPTISQQPQPLDVTVGQTATMSVTATGPGTLAYQWRQDGTPLTDGGRVSGATTATLTITPAARADSGDYSVVITSSACGTATSQAATLNVYCQVDTDRNGQIEPADVSLFVNRWFFDLQNGTFNADFDGNGAVEPADVSLFISRWFAALTTGAC